MKNQKVLGFNKREFVTNILNEDFNGNLKMCARDIGISERCLRDLIFEPSRNASCETLSLIYHYCEKVNRNPLSFIFKNA